jgi:hypothetical protein
VELADHARAGLVGVEFDAVADAVGGPEGDDGAGGVAFFGDDAGEQGLRIGEELGGFGADDLVLEDIGEAAVDFPGAEERAPVDELDEFIEVDC